MALQIRAAERFNHRVYYGFYGVHSEWTSEHEQGRRKRTGTYALCISLFPVSAASQVNNSERYFKFLAIINQKKKKKDKHCKAMCSIHLFTNCSEHRQLCGSPYHCLQLWLGCQWGIWGAGWGRQEGLGAVIKLPLFPPGSLQGSNSALIG